jgi:hypothetical protein
MAKSSMEGFGSESTVLLMMMYGQIFGNNVVSANTVDKESEREIFICCF